MDEDKKVCTMCGGEFDTQEDLDMHNKQVHGMGGSTEDEGDPTGNDGPMDDDDDDKKMSGGM